jgi:Nucleotidyltransferase of unknown function (DUF6036)
MPPEIPEPWRAFLRDVDGAAPSAVTLCCLGGFVVAMQYGMPRPTADIDLLSVAPEALRSELAAVAGRSSPLHVKHKVYLDFVVLRVQPANYEDRLTEMFAGAFDRLRLMALDPYDLALTKLDRNSPKDREDFLYLAEAVPLDLAALRARYDQEMAPYLFEATDKALRLTLDLWIASAEEIRSRRRP